MSTRHRVLALALAVALGVPAAAGAQDFSFTYLEGGCIAGFNLGADAEVDDDGLGGEVGVIWAAKPTIHLQGHVRYTSVGEVTTDGSNDFDSDTLVGINGRWYFRPDTA